MSLWLDRVLGLLAGLLLFGLMVMTAVDVVSRYVFNWPLRGAFELTELALLVLIFAGLPLASRSGEHATMDFIDGLLGWRGSRLLIRLVDLVCGAIILGLGWQVWVKADKIAGYGDVTDVLKLPISPFIYFMAIMVWIAGLIHVAKEISPGTMASSSEFDPNKASAT